MIARLQELKGNYRSDFEQWKNLKSEINYCQNLVNQCQNRLLQGKAKDGFPRVDVLRASRIRHLVQRMLFDWKRRGRFERRVAPVSENQFRISILRRCCRTLRTHAKGITPFQPRQHAVPSGSNANKSTRPLLFLRFFRSTKIVFLRLSARFQRCDDARLVEARACRHRDDAHGSSIECQFAPGSAVVPRHPTENTRRMNSKRIFYFACVN